MTTKAEARAFAIAVHGGQLYGKHPYVFHLDQVADIASHYGPEAEVLAYLHDTVEDTSATLDEVRERFGSFIADCVALLTDQPGGNRKERKSKTYAKLAQVHDERQLALIVKAADRLANVRACVVDGNERLLGVYRGEHEAFKQAAYRPGLCDELWDELDQVLNPV
jgi:(p)ppGpp synthase/HD superfamily hydrolase